MITIKREASWYRPYAIQGRTVRKIHMYNKEGIVLTIDSGWFEVKGYGDVEQFTLGTDEIKLRRKENFNEKEVFIISVKPEYSNEKSCELYIHNDLIGFKKTDRKMNFDFRVIDIWEAESIGAYHQEYRHDIKTNEGIKKLERDFAEIKKKYEFNVTKDEVDEELKRLIEIRAEWKKEKERLEKLDINKL